MTAAATAAPIDHAAVAPVTPVGPRQHLRQDDPRSRGGAIIAASVLLGLVFIGVTGAIATAVQHARVARRDGRAHQLRAADPAGLAGPVVNVGTMGGYLQYKYGTFFPLLLSLWSILALSGTLAAEARRGSLEFVAASGLSRRRIALEKLAGHLTGLGHRRSW